MNTYAFAVPYSIRTGDYSTYDVKLITQRQRSSFVEIGPRSIVLAFVVAFVVLAVMLRVS